ncbi:MAG: anthrone oxygenase family protein, partial [Pseudomonadota bacterium]
MSGLFFFVAQFSVIAYAIVGGIFIAFSDFIMRSLARTSGTGGVEAMQVINREVFRWVFMILFLGLAPVSLGIALYGVVVVGGATGTLLAAAGLTYFIGCFGVTVAFNVPLNERLAKMSLADASTGVFWHDTYVPNWTRWNTVRGSACI